MVTRIATRIGALEGNSIPFIEGDRAYIDKSFLILGHTLKKGLDNSLIFFFMGYTNEIPLPNADFHLYNCHSLTIPLVQRERGRRHSVSSLPVRMTRSKTRREEMPTPPQHTQTSYHHEAGGSSWHSASTEEWARQAPGRRSTSSSSNGPPVSAKHSASSRGFATLTQQMGELNMRTNHMGESLNHHIQSTQD